MRRARRLELHADTSEENLVPGIDSESQGAAVEGGLVHGGVIGEVLDPMSDAIAATHPSVAPQSSQNSAPVHV
jgi:hypothetical protein